LSYLWNGGRILGVSFTFQFIRGLLLVIYYAPLRDSSFFWIDYLSREVWWGFCFRTFHLNGASFIFFFIYFHAFRGFLKFSFRLRHLWASGTTLILLFIITSFLGYVLPWGQMSLWAATVICSFITTIPVLGKFLLFWVWGGFLLRRSSLKFFFLLHFLMPFIILCIVIFHLLILHERGRTRIIFVHENFSKIWFSPYFWVKDLLFFLFFSIFFVLIFIFPWRIGDPENWIYANPNISPLHIQPEWYFLCAYAILRGIPSKLGGVLALCLRVVGLYFLSFYFYYTVPIKFIPHLSWAFMWSFWVLTWLGRCPVEVPFIFLRQFFSLIYFIFLFLFPVLIL